MLQAKLKRTLGVMIPFLLVNGSAMPSRANVIGQLAVSQMQRASAQFEMRDEVVLKRKRKHRKHANDQYPTTPDQAPGNSSPQPGTSQPRPVGNHVSRPGGICIGGRIWKRRCACRANEVRTVLGQNIFACKQGTTPGLAKQNIVPAANLTPASGKPSAVLEPVESGKFVTDEILMTVQLSAGRDVEAQVAATYGWEILQRTDLALLDRRIVTKRYGRQILQSLPPFQRTIEDAG